MATTVLTGADRKLPLFGIPILAILGFVIGYYVDAISTKTLMFVIIGGMGFSVLLLPYEWAIRLLFVYLGIEGMAKLLTNYNPVVHVGSDLLIMALTGRWFITFMVSRAELPADRLPLIGLFGAHFAWFLIEFCNPYGIGLIPSLAAAKMYIDPVLLFAYGYYLTRSLKDAHWFMAPWVFTVFLQIVTGLYQAYIGPSSVTGLHPQYIRALKLIDGPFRPFGTTHLPGVPAIFIYMTMPFLVYFVARTKSNVIRLLMIAMIPSAIFLMILCQVRSAMIKATIGVALFLLLGFRGAPLHIRRRIMLAVPVLALVLVTAIPYLTARWSKESSDTDKAVQRSLTILDYNKVSSARGGAMGRFTDLVATVPFGAGLSRAGAAANAFQDQIAVNPFYSHSFFADNFWIAVMSEMGLPGLLIMDALVLGILIRGFLVISRLSNQDLAPLPAAIFAALASIVAGFPGAEGLLYNPEAPFFWFFAGLLLAFPRLDMTQRSG